MVFEILTDKGAAISSRVGDEELEQLLPRGLRFEVAGVRDDLAYEVEGEQSEQTFTVVQLREVPSEQESQVIETAPVTACPEQANLQGLREHVPACNLGYDRTRFAGLDSAIFELRRVVLDRLCTPSSAQELFEHLHDPDANEEDMVHLSEFTDTAEALDAGQPLAPLVIYTHRHGFNDGAELLWGSDQASMALHAGVRSMWAYVASTPGTQLDERIAAD